MVCLFQTLLNSQQEHSSQAKDIGCRSEGDPQETVLIGSTAILQVQTGALPAHTHYKFSAYLMISPESNIFTKKRKDFKYLFI